MDTGATCLSYPDNRRVFPLLLDATDAGRQKVGCAHLLVVANAPIAAGHHELPLDLVGLHPGSQGEVGHRTLVHLQVRAGSPLCCSHGSVRALAPRHTKGPHACTGWAPECHVQVFHIVNSPHLSRPVVQPCQCSLARGPDRLAELELCPFAGGCTPRSSHGTPPARR